MALDDVVSLKLNLFLYEISFAFSFFCFNFDAKIMFAGKWTVLGMVGRFFDEILKFSSWKVVRNSSKPNYFENLHILNSVFKILSLKIIWNLNFVTKSSTNLRKAEILFQNERTIWFWINFKSMFKFNGKKVEIQVSKSSKLQFNLKIVEKNRQNFNLPSNKIKKLSKLQFNLKIVKNSSKLQFNLK